MKPWFGFFPGLRLQGKHIISLCHVPFFCIYVTDSIKGYTLFNQFDFGLCWG